MFEKMRDFDEAIATYNKIIRRDKNNFQSFYRIGYVFIKKYEKIGNRSSALRLQNRH